MAANVSDFVWRRVREWGIQRVYGYPGDGVDGLDVALERAKAELQYIQVRHCDGSVFPTTGGVNPSLTITSIAMRTADRIRALAARGEL